MNAKSDFTGSLRGRLESLLESFATVIASQVPGTAWRVELPVSRVYDLVALLTFMSSDDLHSELVTVSLETRDLSRGTWAIDVTDRESMPLNLAGDPTAETADIDMSSVDTVARDLDAKLQMWSERIVSELRP